MFVWRIWNETTQSWFESSSRSFWASKSGASVTKNYYLNQFKFFKEPAHKLIIKKFELKEIESE